MKEENSLLRKVGTENPFRVPEGYFENFSERLIEQLTEKDRTTTRFKEPTLWDKIKPWVYMAAVFAAAAFIIRIGRDDNSISEADAELMADEYLDAAIDESLLDDYSFYVYLTDADAGQQP